MSDPKMVLPRIRQKVELQVLTGPFAAAYSTMVDDLDQDGITLALPLLGGRPIPLARGQTVRVEYAQSGAARIAFQTTVESIHTQPLPSVRLVKPQPMHFVRFQQRSFVRLEVSLPLRYRMVREQRFDPRLLLSSEGRVADLSASGMQVLLPEALDPGDNVVVAFNLHGDNHTLLAEVVRQIGQVGVRLYAHGLRFIEVDEQERQAILRYIFAEQRERRRQGLL